MPFMELQAQYDLSMSWDNPNHGPTLNAPYGRTQPEPWNTCGMGPGEAPWNIVRPDLRCPSDPQPSSAIGNVGHQGCSNYCFSRGDNTRWSEDNNNRRGAFGAAAVGNPLGSYKAGPKGYTFASFTDGTSNTIAMSENAVGRDRARWVIGGIACDSNIEHGGHGGRPIDCLTRLQPDNTLSGNVRDWRGMRWADGGITYTGFNTVIGPNGPACVRGCGDADGGVLPPSSYHPGGVNGLLADGAVRWFGNDIDTGNLTAVADPSGTSPFGVWGAIGSKNGGEAIEAQQ
jgi:prepilin-type processing-associated H-X9-DG protein